MKIYLLLAFFFSGIAAMAQTDNAEFKCEARFKYEINDMFMSPLPVAAYNFYDVSEGNAIAWFWDFGDGNRSTEQNPLHVFDRPVPAPNIKINPYRVVSLTILTSDSCKSIYADTINIMEGIMEYGCRAEFKYYEAEFDSVSGTTSIQFTNLSEGDSLQYFWQFDNGFTSSEKEPRIKFDSKQTKYEVCLKVLGANNCSDVFCDPVYIQNPIDSVPDPEECYTGFGYKINYTVQTYAPALVLDFYSKADPVAVEWKWDFGDGYTSNEENPMHIFSYPIILDSILGDPNPFREVCLTVKTISGCIVSYCETINVYITDSVFVEPISSHDKYYMKYESSFPLQMSSCAGYVKAQVYWGDSLINARDYKWSHGVEGQEANGFCPTQTYTVKAKAPDGIIVSGNFIFNSDGTVTEIPVFWQVSGEKENLVIQVNPNSRGYFVEWKLCDGTVITADSISFHLINCDMQESNMILKDSLGNVIYSENISGKSIATFIHSIQNTQQIKLFPNPVKDVLNILYSGSTLDEMVIEVYNISGKRILNQTILNVESGQNIGVNVNSLINGIYLCKVISGSQLVAVEKFSK